MSRRRHMNKTDWIEYFEAIHSRIPNEAEITQALAAGEFSDDEIAEAAEIVEETVSKEGNESGKTVTSVESSDDESITSATENKTADFKSKEKEVIEKLKDNQVISDGIQVAFNYFSWVLETVKHPMSKASGFNSLYTYLTLGIIILFASLSSTLNLHAFYEKTIVNSSFSEFGSFVGISTKNPIGFGTFIGLLFVAALFILTLFFATWVALKVLKSPLTFSNVADKYTSLFIPATFLIVIASILSLIRLNMLSYIVFILALSIMSIALYYIILTAKNNLKLDDFYAKLLALMACGAIICVMTFILVLIFTTIIFKSAFTM